MKRPHLTYLICLDEHRNLSEDVKKRFADEKKYRIIISASHIDFLRTLNEAGSSRSCRIAIISLNDSREQELMTENLTQEIKKTDPATGVILIYPDGKSEQVKNTMKFNIDTYIPRNDNTLLRLHNAVKKQMSEYNLGIYRRRRNISLYILVAAFILSVILVLGAYLKFSEYF